MRQRDGARERGSLVFLSVELKQAVQDVQPNYFLWLAAESVCACVHVCQIFGGGEVEWMSLVFFTITAGRDVHSRRVHKTGRWCVRSRSHCSHTRNTSPETSSDSQLMYLLRVTSEVQSYF